MWIVDKSIDPDIGKESDKQVYQYIEERHIILSIEWFF